MVTGRPLTVVLLVNDLRIGGAERQLVELARGLDKTRFRVIVTTLYSGQPLEDELRDCAGVTLISLERSGKFDFRTVLRLASLLRREQVDVIQPFLTPATAFGMPAAMIARTPVKIVTERCGVRLNTHFGNNAYRFVEDRLTRFADAVVPNSEAGARTSSPAASIRRKVRVIYNGVARPNRRRARRARSAARGAGRPGRELADRHRRQPDAGQGPRHVPPGRLDRPRGRCPDEVRHRRRRAAARELERRSRELGLDDSVIFAGHQLRVAPYIGAMDVAVLSSSDHEGCSNFLLEAMGLGRPIVATDVGGNRELFTAGDAGLLVPPQDPLMLAHAILDVLQDTEAAERMRGEAVRSSASASRWRGWSRPTRTSTMELWAQKPSPAAGGPSRSRSASRDAEERAVSAQMRARLVVSENMGCRWTRASASSRRLARWRALSGHGAVLGIATGGSGALPEGAVRAPAKPLPAAARSGASLASCAPDLIVYVPSASGTLFSFLRARRSSSTGRGRAWRWSLSQGRTHTAPVAGGSSARFAPDSLFGQSPATIDDYSAARRSRPASCRPAWTSTRSGR